MPANHAATLLLPAGVEHPDRQQGVVGVGHIHVDVLGNGVDLAVAAGGGVERIGRGVVHPAVGALGAGIGILVIPVGQIAGQVGRGEGLQVMWVLGILLEPSTGTLAKAAEPSRRTS